MFKFQVDTYLFITHKKALHKQLDIYSKSVIKRERNPRPYGKRGQILSYKSLLNRTAARRILNQARFFNESGFLNKQIK
jgi:hypothetical protein